MRDMAILAALAAYGALLLVPAPLLLRRARWVLRAPGLALLLWLALSAAGALSLGLAAFALAVLSPWRGGTVAGIALTVLLLARGGRGVAGAVAATRRRSRRQAELVALVGRPLPQLGAEAVIVDHPSAAAYCLGGRRRRIIVTSGAVRALDQRQLHAVVAHERAHLRGRHHLALLAVDAAALAFGGLPLFGDARREVPVLVEMRADDVAARHHGRAAVAAALVGVASGALPGSVLAAGGPGALRRIRRLLVPPRPLGLPGRAAGVAGAVLAVAFPVSLSCLPLTVGVYLAAGALARA